MKFEIDIFNQTVLKHDQKSRQKLKYLENEKSFWGEIKSIFHHFKRAFSCQKLYQTWESAFNGWPLTSLSLVTNTYVFVSVVRNVSFLENLAHLLSGWPLMSLSLVTHTYVFVPGGKCFFFRKPLRTYWMDDLFVKLNHF